MKKPLEPNSTVTLIVSAGPAPIAIPDVTGLDHELPAVVVEPEVALVERERHGLRGARRERQALEAAQAAHRLRDARHRIVDVELHDVIAQASDRATQVSAQLERSGVLSSWMIGGLGTLVALGQDRGSLRDGVVAADRAFVRRELRALTDTRIHLAATE